VYDGELNRRGAWRQESGVLPLFLDPQAARTDFGRRVVARVLGPSASATPEFLHHTASGSVVTRANSTPVRSSDLRPYGFDASGAANVSLTLRYHSYGRNRFGIDYAINRHYDPETGRFLQPDPLGQAAYQVDDPQSLNLYAFTRSDPINRRDTLGLYDCKVEHVMPYGSINNTEFYYKKVYETIVPTKKGDGEDIIDRWVPGWTGAWAPWQMSQPAADDQTVSDALDKAMAKKLRQMREKKEKCSAGVRISPPRPTSMREQERISRCIICR
jgi:RHS repeat-associated protein